MPPTINLIGADIGMPGNFADHRAGSKCRSDNRPLLFGAPTTTALGAGYAATVTGPIHCPELALWDPNAERTQRLIGSPTFPPHQRLSRAFHRLLEGGGSSARLQSASAEALRLSETGSQTCHLRPGGPHHVATPRLQPSASPSKSPLSAGVCTPPPR